MKNIIKILSIISSLAIYLYTSSTVYAGLGISPSSIIAPNMSRGSKIEKEFVLSRSDPVDDLRFKVSMEGDTKRWTVVDKGKSFVMPKGQQRFVIKVSTTIPSNAAFGEYHGGIRLSSTSLDANTAGDNGAATALSAYIQTNITVTRSQVLEYIVSALNIKKSEVGSPIDLSVTISNTGNVAAKPSSVYVEIFDNINVKKLESTNVDPVNSIPPFTQGSIDIPIPTSLGMGEYWGHITAYDQEKVLKQEQVVFEIVERGSLGGNVLSATTSVYTIVGGLLLLFVVITFIVYLILSYREGK